MRAAASSIASGNPSRHRQIWSTIAALALVNRKSGTTACARSTNNVTAGPIPGELCPSGASASGLTGKSRSPDRASVARLLARTRSRGQWVKRSATRDAAGKTCSTLSITNRRSRSPSARKRLSRSGRRPRSWTPTAAATAAGTSAGSRTGASSTRATPSATVSAISVATARASRVLPTPPGPVRVKRRQSSSTSRATAVATSASRPIRDVSGRGRWPSAVEAAASGAAGSRRMGCRGIGSGAADGSGGVSMATDLRRGRHGRPTDSHQQYTAMPARAGRLRTRPEAASGQRGPGRAGATSPDRRHPMLHGHAAGIRKRAKCRSCVTVDTAYFPRRHAFPHSAP